MKCYSISKITVQHYSLIPCSDGDIVFNYKFIKEKPNRTCRAETLMRLLMSTSYPKSQFSNICLAFAECSDELDMDYLEDLSGQLREVEKGYGMLDFARSIELIKRGSNLTLKLNILKFNSNDDQITDIKDNHETILDMNIDCPILTNTNTDNLTHLILETFYNSQRKNKKRSDKMEQASWAARTRYIDRSVDDSNIVMDVKPSFNEIIAMVKKSLIKNNFNLLLLQNKIILADQKTSISIRS